MEPGFGGPSESFFDLRENVQAAQQVLLAEAAGKLAELLVLLRPLQQVRPVGRGPHHRQVPQVVHEQRHEVLQIPALAHQFLDDLEDRPAVPLDDCRRGAAADLDIRNADHLAHVGSRDRAVHRRDDLIECRERVPETSLPEAGDLGQGFRGNLETLVVHDVPQPLGHDALRHGAELELLAARQDGVGNAVDLGGGKDELDVGRGFLEGLEERVESAPAQHVDLVHQEDLETVARRGVVRGLDDLARFFHAVVARAVDLGDVPRVAAGDLAAGRTGSAGFRGRALARRAVERLRQNPGGGRLPHSPRSGKEERVPDAVLPDRVLEGAGDRLLAHEVGEGLRPVAERQHLVVLRRRRGGRLRARSRAVRSGRDDLRFAGRGFIGRRFAGRGFARRRIAPGNRGGRSLRRRFGR